MAAAQFGACVGPGALIFVGTAAPLAPMSGSCPFFGVGAAGTVGGRAMPMLLCRARRCLARSVMGRLPAEGLRGVSKSAS